MKLRNYTLTFNLLKNFLESKIYYGSPKSITKNNFNIYLHGLRNNIGIINLNFTFQNLKKFKI